jgi:hypothetical protein
MRLSIMMATVVVVATGFDATGTERSSGQEVVVYIYGETLVPPRIVTLGEGIARNMFHNIGVDLKWRGGEPRVGQAERERAIVVEITDKVCHLSRGAVAFASPYGPSKITICYRNMQGIEHDPVLGPRFFGHVLAHEITHCLQGVNRHSETGVMKAVWTEDDNADMSVKPLPFEPADVTMIHSGIEARTRQLRENKIVSRAAEPARP